MQGETGGGALKKIKGENIYALLTIKDKIECVAFS